MYVSSLLASLIIAVVDGCVNLTLISGWVSLIGLRRFMIYRTPGGSEHEDSMHDCGIPVISQRHQVYMTWIYLRAFSRRHFRPLTILNAQWIKKKSSPQSLRSSIIMFAGDGFMLQIVISLRWPHQGWANSMAKHMFRAAVHWFSGGFMACQIFGLVFVDECFRGWILWNTVELLLLA